MLTKRQLVRSKQEFVLLAMVKVGITVVMVGALVMPVMVRGINDRLPR